MKNIVYRCKLSIAKQKSLLLLFQTGSTARAAARNVGVNRMTAILFFRKLREKIAAERLAESQKKKIGAGDVVEVDECYTSGGKGGRKVARQGRGLAGKIAFAGAIERHGRRVRIERIESANRENLTSFIVRNVRRGSTVHTDSFKSYLDVPKYGYTHCRVNHFLTFKDRKSGACTNMIESVWSQMLCHWERFRGGFRNNLNLWIAEIEFRIENNKNLPLALKRILRKK